MRDITARWMACIALAVAAAGVGGYAHADSITEPDAYALAERVYVLEDQVAGLAAQQDAVDDYIVALYANDAILDERTNEVGCFARSDYHYVRETLNGSKRKYRMPLVVRTCSKNWKPKRRMIAPKEMTR